MFLREQGMIFLVRAIRAVALVCYRAYHLRDVRQMTHVSAVHARRHAVRLAFYALDVLVLPVGTDGAAEVLVLVMLA